MEIRVRDVRKTFSGAAAALNGVSLDVVSGELVALLGPSGSGKTTLLRVIAGLEKPSAGEVFFGDQPATTLSVQQRRVGFVFQHYALFKHMTVLDNIGYGMRVRPRAQRPSREDIRARVLELLDLVQLTGLEGRYPAQLSGGQRQRVALARALAVEPRVLLLDEPFGALDAKVRKDLRRWLRAIHDKTGHTTLFVTHDQEEALELADRVAVLDKGRIEQIGTPDDIYERPASPFVFGFIGESSVIPVEIRSGRALFDGRPLGVAADGLDDGPGHLHLRPQDGRLAAAGNPGLPGRLLGIRRTASNRRAEVALGTGGPVIEVDIAPESALARGDEIAIDIARGRVFKRPV